MALRSRERGEGGEGRWLTAQGAWRPWKTVACPHSTSVLSSRPATLGLSGGFPGCPRTLQTCLERARHRGPVPAGAVLTLPFLPLNTLFQPGPSSAYWAS